MAGTIVLVQFEDGKVSIEADYNDNSKLTTLRVENGSTEHRAGVTLFHTTPDPNGNYARDGMSYTLTCEAATQDGNPMRTALEIPSGPQGITLTLGTKPGHFNGYEADLRFPW